ncbi:DUF58 domain-containing protein [Frigoribacterium sp. CFBP 8754]|uniref:DUF58 domain-containing protein n=1 Tax=unclassified Frigoribacterium TaxID=2627005 RepID=UPI000AF7333D|nr:MULTISPECIES: DUF58 domain-containing protein [unclassified Frigoribacterium]MBD8659270.1 DUF58 domain-containing protein [Frigoribacterium sp. CFBP 8754]MBD8727564.1 DUF58 domain-containing protein [Frigoribacterium sp. CFBP 13707]QNE42436.1 DUF58 domain-containing protein [Frigoribacterium sp. NBH87]
MPGLLLRVRTKMSLFAHRRTLDLLEGGYASVHHGRSHDFDDLRAYVPGDEVRDIDWKATARHGEPLVKRYIASRRRHLVLVVDTGRNMAATAAGGETKKDIAVMAAGALGYIAAQHGDVVSLVAGDESGTRAHPAGSTDAHLEMLLRRVDERVSLEAPRSDLHGVLSWVARGVRRRSMLLVVADDVVVDEALEKLLRRLRAQHEILWLTVGDADLMSRTGHARDLYDVQEASGLPAYLRENGALRVAFDASSERRVGDAERQLQALGISSVRLTAQSQVVPGLSALIEKHRRARR